MIFKRVLVPFVAAAMCASMIPATVMADAVATQEAVAVVDVVDNGSESPSPISGKCGPNLNYKVNSEGVLVISGTGSMNNYAAGKAPWYAAKDKISGIAFSGKPTSIGNYAFYGLNISSANIHSGITSIGTGAFYGSSVTKVNGGASLKKIGTSAFKNTKKLTTFIITSKSLSSIGSQAFSGSALKTIKITKTTKLTKKGVKNSLKGSSVKTVDVVNTKKLTYGTYFKKSNSGKKVTVK